MRQWNPVAASKSKNQEIQKLLNRGLRYTEIQKVVDCSPRTISNGEKTYGQSRLILPHHSWHFDAYITRCCLDLQGKYRWGCNTNGIT
jgi:hypothetical protein